MAEVLTGMAEVDKLIRGILGEDDDEDDAADAGEWADVTALDSLAPDRLDLVDTPASGLPFLVMKRAGAGKARGGPAAAGLIVKSAPEQRYTLCCVYQADKPDISTALDGFRDFAPKAALQDAAWGFLKRGAKVGLMHRDGSTAAGVGEVVESYLWPGEDWQITAVDGSRQVIKRGDWMCGVRWSEPAWRSIKNGTYRGVSMQGAARRRKPTKAELAGLRKSAGKPPKCKRCKKKAEAGARFCPKCGRSFSTGKRAPRPVKAVKAVRRTVPASPQAVSKAAAAVARVDRVISRARSCDPAVRDPALGQLMQAFGPQVAADVVAGKVTAASFGGRLVKAAEVLEAGGPEEASRCKTCAGSGRLRHPVTGKASRKCPSCRGDGRQRPDGDDAPVTKADADLIAEWIRQANGGRGERAPEAMGRLVSMLGPDVAVRLVSGEPVSPGEFRRAYVRAGRALQSAAPDQEPRIPQSTHVISAEDFRRAPLTARHERPSPASVWPPRQAG